MQGLQRMVELRGGLERLGMRGILRRLVFGKTLCVSRISCFLLRLILLAIIGQICYIAQVVRGRLNSHSILDTTRLNSPISSRQPPI